MRWYLKLVVLLATPTAIRAGKEYYPSNCNSKSFSGTDCVLTCRGKDACDKDIKVPSSSKLQNFVVRCVTDNACNSLEFEKRRSAVKNYLMCIPDAESCNSAEKAAEQSSFLYCEGGRNECGDRYKNKGVATTATKNGISVVIFTNDVAVGRSQSAKGEDAGIISDPNGPFFILFFLPYYH